MITMTCKISEAGNCHFIFYFFNLLLQPFIMCMVSSSRMQPFSTTLAIRLKNWRTCNSTSTSSCTSNEIATLRPSAPNTRTGEFTALYHRGSSCKIKPWSPRWLIWMAIQIQPVLSALFYMLFSHFYRLTLSRILTPRPHKNEMRKYCSVVAIMH